MRRPTRPWPLPVALAAALLLAAAGGAAASAHAVAPPKVQTEALVAGTLAGLPRYPGATRAEWAGFPIDQAPSVPASPELVSAHALWYAPVSSARFAVWAAQAFAAKGLHADGSSQTSGPSGPEVDGLTFVPSPDTDQIAVLVSWQATNAKSTAVRYDVQAIWQPPVPADATLPKALGEAVITLTDQAHPKGLTVTARGRALGALAAVSASLPVDTRGAHSCPAEIGQIGRRVIVATAVRVRFVWDGGSLTFAEGQDSCASAIVEGAGGRSLAVLFDPGMRILRAAEKVVGAA